MNSLVVFLGNGDGTFQPAALTTLSGTVMDLSVTDLTGDGKPDVLAVLGGSGSGIDILPGRGDGSLAAPIVLPAGSPGSAITPDFNGDGKPDLFYTVGNGGVGASLGRGDGSFAAPTSFITLGTYQMKAGDLNRDGRPDVALATWGSGGQIVLFMNASH